VTRKLAAVCLKKGGGEEAQMDEGVVEKKDMSTPMKIH
jgi:hypothetical protein